MLRRCLALALMSGMAAACVSPVDLAAVPTVTPPVVQPESTGYLEGRASIGPLNPVERVGVLTPAPSPDQCTSRGLARYTSKVETEVMSFSFQPGCRYRVALNPGTYVVRLREAQSIGGSKDLPKTVVIEAGRTFRLDINMDTGIR
ncbi:MAG: hypothetical protein Q7R39_02685 [Dehalococcoidia bacterium]|nr:hypothetical protein [Dehalococcoidia bacterium]